MLEQSIVLPGYFRFIGFDNVSVHPLGSRFAMGWLLAVLASVAAGCQLFPGSGSFWLLVSYRIIKSRTRGEL